MAYDIYAETTALNADKIESMLKQFTYKEGWAFSIFTHTSHTVSIFELRIGVTTRVSDSLVGDKTAIQMLVNHPFSIPQYLMDDREAERWLLDCILMVEQHGACKRFKIGGKDIFYQEPGEGAISYRITRKR